MDISNKTLAVFLVITIAISLIGTLVAMDKLTNLEQFAVTGLATGNETDTGTATLQINSTARLIFSDDAVDWVTGYVNTSGGNVMCNLTTDNYNDGTAYCVGFATEANGLTLRNDGNSIFTTVWLNASASAATLISGSNPSIKLMLTEELTATCLGSLQMSAMTEINATHLAYPGEVICNTPGLNYSETADDIYIDINVSIPYDSLTGSKTLSLVATGEY
jgi:hypothetical protein